MRIGLGAAATVLLLATPGHAFGLRTHLYIAERVWNDLADCSVSVAGENVLVDQSLCRAIRNNKGAFLAGAIGPDAFPDLLIGQNYVHPGTPNGRQSADWLQIVLEAAETPEELAFAYGQLIHAAGDIFAHSYVNNYAGGVFELTARWHKDVEQRHFELEKYIDQRLPYEAPLDELVVPSNLLVRSMVRAPYIPGEITLTTGDLREFARGPGPASARAARLIGEKVGRAVPASHMTGMHVMLVVSDRAARGSVCDEVRAVYALADSYERYLRAEALARGAAPNWPARTSPVIADENCTAHELAAAEAVLRAVDKLTADIPWHDGAMNARETWLRTLDLERRAELAASYGGYLESAKTRERTRAIAAFAPLWRDDVQLAVEAYMQASLQSARSMVQSSEPVPPPVHLRRSATFPYEAWWDCYGPVFAGDPAEAASARCARIDALGVDQSLSTTALRTGIGRYPRGLLFAYLDIEQAIEEFTTDILLGILEPANPALVGLGRDIINPTRISRDKLNATFQEGRNGQVTFECVSDLIDVDLGLLPRTGGERDLLADSACQNRGANGAGTAEFFDPRDFRPIEYAVTLGSLALLDASAIRSMGERWAGETPSLGAPTKQGRYSVILDMARSLDGSQQWRSVSLPPPRADGLGPEWPTEGAGYPVARASDVVAVVSLDPAIDAGRPGFPFYQTTGLRTGAFTRLFPDPFEGEILRRREFNADHYAYRPCAGDPFRPLADPARTSELCDRIAPSSTRVPDAVVATLRAEYQSRIDECLGRGTARRSWMSVFRRQQGCLG